MFAANVPGLLHMQLSGHFLWQIASKTIVMDCVDLDHPGGFFHPTAFKTARAYISKTRHFGSLAESFKGVQLFQISPGISIYASRYCSQIAGSHNYNMK